MDQAAEKIEPGSHDLLFFPHLSGEYAPQWDPDLRASFVGLTTQHNRAHLTRSVLEGVAYQIRSALDQISSDGEDITEIRLIGGGANSQLWALIMANVVERPLLVPLERSAAYGAALLAGMAIGLFDESPNNLSRIVRIEKRIEPGGNYLEVYQKRYNLYRDIADELTAVNIRLKTISNEVR
jgi:xylulokinase